MMITFILNISEKVFNILRDTYESRKANRIISISLVLVFLLASSLSVLINKNYFSLGELDSYFQNPFFSIEIAFVILLMFELLSLIFILPKSVSQSVGKQLELLSLIFIRGAFKEFSRIDEKIINGHDFSWNNIPDPILNMAFYAFGALIIFTLLGFTNNMRRHTPLTNVEGDTLRFMQAKKLISLFLLFSFFVIVIADIVEFTRSGYYAPSFHTFYTILIFADILIVLVALRYTLNYYKIFRYSAFVVATIFIRLALSVKPYYDVIIGVFATIFVMLLTLTYNYFLKDVPASKLKD